MTFAKLHPLLVHFPVGLLVSGSLFELYGAVRKEQTVAVAGWFNTRLGFWCALPVAAVGLLGIVNLEVEEKFKGFLAGHILSVFLTVTLFLGVLILSRFRDRLWGRIFYYSCLLCGLVSVLATGYFGGELVHRFGVSTIGGVR